VIDLSACYIEKLHNFIPVS